MLFSIMAAIGLTHILVDGSLFNGIRHRLQYTWLSFLFNCHQCSGFWCGIVSGLFLYDFTWIQLFAFGCITSFLSKLVALIMSALEN